MINIEQITAKFSKLPIEEIGISSGFIKIRKKISALVFVMGFFSSQSEGSGCKLTSWSQNISLLLGDLFSKQALESRLGFRCVCFCEQLLGASISYNLRKELASESCNEEKQSKHWSKAFNRVFVEDSTCFRLPDLMFPIFGGGANQKGKHCLARIQLRIELMKEQIHNIAIRAYGENDRAFSEDIVSSLQTNDLVIRDLGYHDLSVFERIMLKGAYFISRWFPTTLLFDSKTAEKIELGKFLSKLTAKGIELWEQDCLVGFNKKIPLRVVFIKVPQEVAEKRRQDALKKEKSKSIKYSQHYFEHLDWSIYITNIPCSMLKILDIWKIYTFRWRIEIIFKAWKSHLNLENILVNRQYINPCHLLIRLYLMMAWVVLCLIPAYNFFQFKIYQAEKRFVSLAKFADCFRNHFLKLVNELNWEYFIPFVKQFCLYDKRKKRKNSFEKLYMLNLS